MIKSNLKQNLKVMYINEDTYLVESNFDSWRVEILPNGKHKLMHKNKLGQDNHYHLQGYYSCENHVLNYIYGHDCYKMNRFALDRNIMRCFKQIEQQRKAKKYGSKSLTI